MQQKKIADPRISKRTYNTRSNQLSYTAILVSNATTRAELFGRSLVCLSEQGQLPTYSPIFYSLRIDARPAYQITTVPEEFPSSVSVQGLPIISCYTGPRAQAIVVYWDLGFASF